MHQQSVLSSMNFLLALLYAVCVGTPAVFLGLSTNRSAYASAETTNIDVVVKKGLLTLEAVDVPLGVVLQRIGEQAGFKIHSRDELVEPVTWSVTEVPLARALGRITRGISSVSIYAPSGRLLELHILKVAHDTKGNEVYLAQTISKRSGGHTKDALAVNIYESLEDELKLVDVLEAKGDTNAANELTEMLSNDSPPILRRRATIGLGKIINQQAKDALIEVLKDSDAVMRRYAVKALGRNWGQKMAKQLNTVLINDTDPTVRHLAAHALGQMGTVEALEVLLAAQFDPDQSVRQTVADSLSRLDRSGVTLERQVKQQETPF